MTTNARGRRPPAHQPFPEILEDRQLLTASLAPITSFSVPAQLGYQLALDGSGSTSSNQTYTATSSNPNIKVSVAQGQFWTVTVSHTAANSSDVTINHESMTFQLFVDLTPQTVARITTLTNDGYYTNGFPTQTPPVPAGQYIPRITSVASSGFSAIQGGSSSPTSTSSSSGLTPIATEPVQQLAFTGQYQIAMANTGAPNSTDAQFFITNGVPSASAQQAFDFNYTIFGQLVSGQQTVTDLSKVAVQNNSSTPPEDSQPITPVVINSVALSSTNPNGVLHIDTTSATAGQTATITVTATDPTDHTTATQSFTVAVSAYNGPTDPVINFRPFANPTTATTNENHPTTIQLAGQSGYPDSSTPGTLSYTIVTQPAHGTVSQFNAATGSLVYTPDPGYYGPDSFQYLVQASGPQSNPATTTSNPASVAITVDRIAVFPVTVTGASDVLNSKNQVTQIVIDFSGPLNASQAVQRSHYRLAFPGSHGSYTAKNARVVLFRKPVYNATDYAVTLTPGRPFALTRKAELLIRGNPPNGLRDSQGHLIDGNHDGHPGGNAIVFLSSSGVIVE
jgi:cyclophilin family peptidyl-prolyl cis-trans isomerase